MKLFLIVCFSSDCSVPVSDISCSWGSGLLPHLWQIFPGLQRGAGFCRLDLICCPRHSKDSCQPQQTSQSPETGQGIHLNHTSISFFTKTSKQVYDLNFWFCSTLRADSKPCLGEAVYVCGSGNHCIPAYPKKPAHLLYLLPATCPYMVLCPKRVSHTCIEKVD